MRNENCIMAFFEPKDEMEPWMLLDYWCDQKFVLIFYVGLMEQKWIDYKSNFHFAIVLSTQLELLKFPTFFNPQHPTPHW